MKILTLIPFLLILLKVHSQAIIDCDYSSPDLSQNLLLNFNFDNSIHNNSNKNLIYFPNNVILAKDRDSELNHSAVFTESSQIKILHNPDLKPDFPFSFSFWTFPYDIKLYSNYIYTSDLLPNVRAGFNIQTKSTTDQVHFFYSNGCYNPSCRIGKITTKPLPKSAWTHVVILVRGPEDIEFYFNGCQVESYFEGYGQKTLQYSNAPSYIAHADPSNYSNNKRSYFNGKIDDFYFWDRIISEKEIKYLFFNYNLPTLELKNQYTLTDKNPNITIELPNIFTDIRWNNESSNNIMTINQEGQYFVEAHSNCHLICHNFSVIDLTTKQNKQIASNTKKIIIPDVIKDKTVSNDTNASILNLDRKSIKEGQILELKRVYFKADSTKIDKNSIPALIELLTFLKENDDIQIEIGGHTNGLPSHEYCDSLSNGRAKAVAIYLFINDIPPNQVTYKGYGKRNPISTNETIKGRKRNQRVEIKILTITNGN